MAEKTIQIADKPTLDSILGEIRSGTYGLNAIKAVANTVSTNAANASSYAKNVSDRLTAARAGYLDYLANASYGLNAIKTAVNTASTNAANANTYAKNVNDRLTAARAGYLDSIANSTYGLSAIKTAIDNISSSVSGGNLYPQAIQKTVQVQWKYVTSSKGIYNNYTHYFDPVAVDLNITGAGKFVYLLSASDSYAKSTVFTVDGNALQYSGMFSSHQYICFGKSLKIHSSFLPGRTSLTNTNSTPTSTPASINAILLLIYLA